MKHWPLALTILAFVTAMLHQRAKGVEVEIATALAVGQSIVFFLLLYGVLNRVFKLQLKLV